MLSYFWDKLTHTGYQVAFVCWQPGEICWKLSTKMQNLTDYRVKPPKFCSTRRIIGASKASTHTQKDLWPFAPSKKKRALFSFRALLFFFEIGFKRKGLSNIFWKERQYAAQVCNTCVTVHPFARWYCKNWFAYLHKKILHYSLVGARSQLAQQNWRFFFCWDRGSGYPLKSYKFCSIDSAEAAAKSCQSRGSSGVYGFENIKFVRFSGCTPNPYS